MNKYKSMVAYITGGISGIGKAIAERIICQGGHVCLADINPAGCKVVKSLGEKALFIQTDVTQECDVIESIRAAKEKFGKINVVINSAGICRYEPIYNFKTNTPHSLDIYKSQMDINVLGTFNVIRLVAGVLAENKADHNQQRAVIVNLASVMAFEPPPLLVAYGATKSAIAGMTLPLARGLASKGIRVVSVGPGYIESPLTAVQSEQEIKKWTSMKLSPKRYGTSDEVAHLIQMIIENPLINGETIRIDMGWRYCQVDDSIDSNKEGC